MTPFNIYLWQMADHFSGVLFGLSLILLLASVFLLAIGISEDVKICRNIGIASSCILIISSISFALMPSSKTIAMMYVLPRIAESKAVQTDLPELYEAAMAALKDQIGITKK